jgi:cytochrome P450
LPWATSRRSRTSRSLPTPPSIDELDREPHAALAQLREQAGPVAWVPALGAWLVLTRERALEVMRDDTVFTVEDPRFTTGRVVGASMLTLDGAEHARHREPFARPFRRAAVLERFTPLVEAEAQRLASALEPGADVRRGFAGPLAAAIVTHALGLRAVGVERVLGWYDAIVGAVTELTAGGALPRSGADGFAALREAMLRSADPGSLFADAARGIGDEEAVSNAAVLLFGGIETTEGMIANAVWHLLTHPDQLALVRAEPGLLVGAVEESLRLEPAAATIDRYATRDVSPVRAGDLVSVSIAAANRDPAVFPDPDRFDVRRRNATLHLAFAHGPHVCIGMHLARLEAHTALRVLLERLGPALRLAEPTAPRGLVFRKPPALRVEF